MKYKHIRSAAHNFAHSFSSLMNYHAADYVMSHLARAAIASGEPELRVDLLTGHAEPEALLPPAVRESIGWYQARFPHHLQSHNVAVDAIRRATLRVRFDLERRTASAVHPGMDRLPFESAVEVEDDRGTLHVGTVRDEWLADGAPVFSPLTNARETRCRT